MPVGADGLAIRVRGQVQGVGFRPFVWQIARRHGLAGEVLNDPEGVLIHAVGGDHAGFLEALRREAPPLSRIDAIETAPWEAPAGVSDFSIAASRGEGARTRVTPDAATCADCLKDIHAPGDRRCGYAFANCTHCGPRFSILQGLPYDRARTTMGAFSMCADCAAEYADPGDRRFHAQPVACPACGPHVWLEPAGQGDPVQDAASRLLEGQILAIKGLGGFHLACDATNAGAIETLRQRKRRPSKPLALMAPMELIERHASVSAAESARLSDPAAPIVLLDQAGEILPDELAPGQAVLGWMLPYTPLHHLLLAAVGRPLVMTSGNLSGEPQVVGNDEAREKLSGFADGFVLHDRDIARRLDDSVERETMFGPMILRRGRGRVPGTIQLPRGLAGAPDVVAYGGQMKSAICLVTSGQAVLSHHLGNLDDALTWDAFVQADADYAGLFDHAPVHVACDLHPDFRATRFADSRGLPVTRVQHHHAHMAACLAENGWEPEAGPVAGIVLDGLGLGTDGTVWGGELLLGGYRDVPRRAWLTPAPLIGGDRAQAEPWRNALVRLDQAGLADVADRLFPDAPLDMARQAAKAGLNAPLSSSAGRLCDAVAAMLGICARGQSYEGEAAMRLEALAQGPTPAPVCLDGPGPEIDPSPLIRVLWSAIERGEAPGVISMLFHVSLAQAFADRARALVKTGEARAVALSGGCFQNVLLVRETLRRLDGVPVLMHRRTPANDGGLALGQAAVAAARLVSH